MSERSKYLVYATTPNAKTRALSFPRLLHLNLLLYPTLDKLQILNFITTQRTCVDISLKLLGSS